MSQKQRKIMTAVLATVLALLIIIPTVASIIAGL